MMDKLGFDILKWVASAIATMVFLYTNFQTTAASQREQDTLKQRMDRTEDALNIRLDRMEQKIDTILNK